MTIKQYPSGALVRIADIVGHKDRPGLLPIDRSTWYRWCKDGKVSDGHRIAGTSTKVWRLKLSVGSRASLRQVNDMLVLPVKLSTIQFKNWADVHQMLTSMSQIV